jgi:hypothetical protein
MNRAHLLPLLSTLALAACSSSTDSMPGPQPEANELAFQTGEFEVPPGDSFTCFYTSTKTDRELTVGDTASTQGPGGHHVTIYFTDIEREPSYHPCDDAEMVSWHMVGGASDTGEPVVPLPPGGALKVPAGKQIVVQSHYINTTGAPQKVNDSVKLKLLEPSEVKEYVNFWVINDASFNVPPNGSATSVSTCTVPKDLNTVLLLGHMHDHGKRYTLERLDDKGNAVETMYDQEWQPDYAGHPPLVTATLEEPMFIPAGTTFRQTCTWNNNTTDPLVFPREMCITFAHYFPDDGWVECNAQPVE